MENERSTLGQEILIEFMQYDYLLVDKKCGSGDSVAGIVAIVCGTKDFGGIIG